LDNIRSGIKIALRLTSQVWQHFGSSGLENEFNTFEHKEEVEYIQKIGTIQFTENYQGEKEPRVILWCHHKSKSERSKK
jgi:lauroyl/myristoyl acyltransferase